MPGQDKIRNEDRGERFTAMPGQDKIRNGDGGERFTAMPDWRPGLQKNKGAEHYF